VMVAVWGASGANLAKKMFMYTKSGGTSGFPGGCPAPNERALIPRFASSGMVARVQPVAVDRA